jgi:hypothetical protein
MAKSYKELASSNPVANTYTELYQVPASTSTVLSTISVCNAASAAGTFRLGITESATAASAIAFAEHFVFDTAIAANDAVMLTLGISMSNQQKLIARAGSASVIFMAWGVEIT